MKQFKIVIVAAALVCAATVASGLRPGDVVAAVGPYSPCAGGVVCAVTQTPADHGDAGSWDFVPQGTDVVVSPVNGSVHFVQNDVPDSLGYSQPSLGNVVWIDGDDGYCYLLGHFQQSSVVVGAGQHLQHGQKVGLQGESGYAFGKHVHVNRMTGCYTYNDPNGKTTAWGAVQQLSFLDVGTPARNARPVSGNYIEGSTPTAPAAPSNLSAQATSASQIVFKWQDNANNEQAFSVWRWSGAAWVNISTVGANVTSYADSGLSASTTYYYTVCVYNAVGGACASGYTQATTSASSSRSTVVVDDRDAGFARGGPGQYWHESSIGYGSHAWWTYNNQSGVENWATWTPRLGGSGNYEVFAFIPRANATTSNAGYRIHHAGRDDVRRPVNQNQYYDAWVSLGTYYFDSSSQEYVFIGDETFEADGSRQVGFDAMKFVPR